jgi:hypothetical protein
MAIGQEQCLATMQYWLFERPLHPELFEIYEEAHLLKGGYEARLWVTGCTHVLQFHRGGETLAEAVAEAAAPLPSRGKLLCRPFRGERAHERKDPGGIDYMVNFQAEVMSPHVYAQTHHELVRQGEKGGGLFVPFPQWRHDALTPFTYLRFDAGAETLHVLGFHAFPEARTLLKTQSIFELG